MCCVVLVGFVFFCLFSKPCFTLTDYWTIYFDFYFSRTSTASQRKVLVLFFVQQLWVFFCLWINMFCMYVCGLTRTKKKVLNGGVSGVLHSISSLINSYSYSLYACFIFDWRDVLEACVFVLGIWIYLTSSMFFLFYFNHLFKKNNSLGTVDNVMIPFYYISYSACFVSLLIIFNLYFICCINADKILYVLCFAVGHRDFGHFFL